MRALLDINVVLDVLLNREPWVQGSQAVWKACDNGRIQGCLAAFTVPTIFYIVRRSSDLRRAQEAVRICLEAFEIVTVARQAIEVAVGLERV